MIHVPREQTDASGAAIQPSATWFARAVEKRERALAERDQHDADRSVYAAEELRTALARVFRDKCAYCESSLLNQDWDVEHFRPKGAVAESPSHPGYYWLAYEWTNLYPSCQLCNQRRRERKRWADSTPSAAGGKADQFPLLDETQRAMHHDAALTAEQPLVLDPCMDDPEAHFSYLPTGEVIATSRAGRGEATIRVLFLGRRALNDLRRDRIEALCGALSTLASLDRDTAAWRELDVFVRRYCDASSEYAAASRAVVRRPADFGL